jgi:hypothetical protein
MTTSIQFKKMMVVVLRGAWRQDTLIGGKPPVLKTLTFKYSECGDRFEWLHCSPASRRRWRKGTPVSGLYLGHSLLGGCTYGDLALQGGESRIWGSKIWSRVPQGSDPRMTALARTSSICKPQAGPIISDGIPHQQTRNCLTATKICS